MQNNRRHHDHHQQQKPQKQEKKPANKIKDSIKVEADWWNEVEEFITNDQIIEDAKWQFIQHKIRVLIRDDGQQRDGTDDTNGDASGDGDNDGGDEGGFGNEEDEIMEAEHVLLNVFGGSLLHDAIALCSISNVNSEAAMALIKYLVDDSNNNGQVRWKNGYDNTPLHVACYYVAPLDIIKFLVNKGGLETVMWGNIYGSTPIHFACSKKTPLANIQYLVEVGGKGTTKSVVTAQNKNGEIPLHIACHRNASLDTIQYLIQKGGKETVTACSNYYLTPFHYAFRKNAPLELIQYLIETGGKDMVPKVSKKLAPVTLTQSVRESHDHVSFQLPLHYVCSFKPFRAVLPVIQSLVNEGGKEQVLATDRDGKNPLHIALNAATEVDVIKYLVGIGGKDIVSSADKNACDTPLHCACRNGTTLDVIKLIVEEGGKQLVLATNAAQNTPLHIVCSHWNPSLDAVQYLVEKGGRKQSVIATNDDGDTPLHILLRNGVYEKVHEIIQYLAQQGGTEAITMTNKCGESPMLLAFRGGRREEHESGEKDPRFDIIRCLVEEGGPETVTVANSNGNTILHCIVPLRAAGSLDIFRYLLQVEGAKTAIPKPNKYNRTILQMALETHKREYSPVIEAIFDAYINHSLLSSLKSDGISETLKWTQNISKNDQQEALKHNFLRNVLNCTFINRNILAFLMLDLYTQICFIVTFGFNVDHIISPADGLMQKMSVAHYICLIFGLTWLITREIAQLCTTSYALYVTNVWNWIDLMQHALVILSMIIITHHSENGNRIVAENYCKLWILTLNAGMVWLQLIQVLSNLFYGIAVFVEALKEITLSIVPFLITVAITVLGFANMFYVSKSTLSGDQCSPQQETSLEDDFSWACSLPNSYFHSFDMLLSGVNLYQDNRSNIILILSCFYAIIIGLIFLNVLIAKISNVFTEVEEMGKHAFWENRLMFVTEVYFSLDAVTDANKQPMITSYNTSFTRLVTGTEQYGTEPPIVFDSSRTQILREENKQQVEHTEDDSLVSSNHQQPGHSRYFRRAFSTITWNDYFDENDQEFKDFLFWWNSQNDSGWPRPSGGVLPPSFRKRFKAFVFRASFQDIFFPDKEFEGIWFGYRGRVPGFFNNVVRFLIPVIVIVWFLLGLVSCGLLWPRWMTRWLFYGETNDDESSTTATTTTIIGSNDKNCCKAKPVPCQAQELLKTTEMNEEVKAEIKEMKSEIKYLQNEMNEFKELLHLILKKV